MNIDEKKKIIVDSINNIENHNKIVNFIHYYEIKHTENNNGYFVNISVISDEIIEKLNELIINLNNNLDDNLLKEKIKIIEENKIDMGKINPKNISKTENNDIKLSEFSGIDKEKISLSKNYKFE